MARRILVTGGTGVIGAWAVREIAAAGDTPIILTRGVTSVGRAILGELAGEVEWMSCDVQQPLALMDAVNRAKPDVIAHLASAKPWQMDVGFVERPDPPLGVRTIIDGTVNVLEVARSLGVERVVYASSKSAYAPFTGEHAAPTYAPVPETYPCRPPEMYGITKLAADQIGHYYRQHLGVDFVSLRFGSTYGPFKRGAGTAPAGLIASAIEQEPVSVTFAEPGYSEALDEFVYNRDIGRAIQVACAAGPTRDWLFNIGTGVGSSIRDVVEAIAGVPGVTPPDVTVVPAGAPKPPGTAGHLVTAHAGVLDVTAAREQLGFEAAYDLSAGIADAAAVIRDSEERVTA